MKPQVKPRTSWMVVLLFVLLCISTIGTGTVIYIEKTASPETLDSIRLFLEGFRPKHISTMPTHPKGVANDLNFFFKLFTGQLDANWE
jgi:hypothetical protein